jgi:hypothetical protein
MGGVMVESTAERVEAPMTRRALSLLLPSALNLGMAQILAPALNAMLARTANPEAAIGGFAVALGISGLVALPQLRIQHLTLVFFEDAVSLARLRRFVVGFAVLVTLLAALVGLTPLSGVVLDRLFATEGALRDEAALALMVLVPFPALMVARMHLYGVALRAERPWIVWVGTGGGAATVLIGAAVLLAAGVDGAPVAAIAVTAGATLEVVALLLATAPIRRAPGRVGTETPTQRALMRFFTPLLFAAFLPAVSTPLITATVSRSPEPDVSLAAFPLAMSIFTFVTLIAGGVQPTVLSLFARGDNASAIGRFAVIVGLVAMIGGVLVAWVPPLTALVVEDLLGTEGRLAELTTVGLRLLSFLPPLMTVEQLYAAALLQTKRTRALVWVNVWRLVGLIAFIVLVPLSTNWSGAAIGAGAVSFTLTLEAVFAWVYGRRAFAELRALSS